MSASVKATISSRLISLTGAKTRTQARKALWGYFFLSPWLMGLTLFVVGPILAALALSFSDYNMIAVPAWIGFDNYHMAFFVDDLFWSSLIRTFTFTFTYVPIGIIGSLLFAILLNQKLTGTSIFRTMFFLPSLTPVVALAILWTWVLHPMIGPVNTFLRQLGLPRPGWFADPAWALPSIVIVALWAGWGGNQMLIFLAGLQGVPEELYEAAEIDGAGTFSRFRHVTLPMISPTILFNFILGIIGAMKVFTLAFVATDGGPARATWFLALHIYRQAFQYYRMGYGSALAWLFALVVMAFTFVQLKVSNRWVFYTGV